MSSRRPFGAPSTEEIPFVITSYSIHYTKLYEALILTGNIRPNPMIEAKADERGVAIILSHRTRAWGACSRELPHPKLELARRIV